jgi:hypothetical protein
MTEIEALEPLIGDWTLEASFENAEPGRATFEWALDRQFVIERSEAPDPAPNGLVIMAWDEGRGGYLQHYFDSRGVVRLYDMTFQNGVWTLTRTKPDFTPLSFSQRYIGTLSEDGKTIAGQWEASDDGTAWKLDFELKYTRVG